VAREMRQPLFYERLLAPIRSLLDDSAFVLTRRFALEFASFKRSRRAALALLLSIVYALTLDSPHLSRIFHLF